jgi:hypothetical protein
VVLIFDENGFLLLIAALLLTFLKVWLLYFNQTGGLRFFGFYALDYIALMGLLHDLLITRCLKEHLRYRQTFNFWRGFLRSSLFS